MRQYPDIASLVAAMAAARRAPAEVQIPLYLPGPGAPHEGWADAPHAATDASEAGGVTIGGDDDEDVEADLY